MKDGKYLYSGIEGGVYLRIKDGSYKCLTADTNTGWEEGEKGDIDELIPSMWELIEDPEVTELREQLAKANERVKELELIIVAITHADETGHVDDVGFVQGWSDVCDETKSLLNKFAIDNQIKALTSLIEHEASTFRLHNGNKRSGVFSIDIKHRIEALKLSKEKE